MELPECFGRKAAVLPVAFTYHSQRWCLHPPHGIRACLLYTSLFDLITSNPPYISDQEMLELQPEVRWEPEMALRAQENGLYFYRVLSKRCQSYLRAGGWLLFEIGYTQGQAVSDLLLAEGYTDIRLIPDYNGNDRVVAARWQPAER